MGHLLRSGWFVFLIAVVKVEAQKNPPPNVDSKCLGSVMYVNVGPLGGRYLEVAALHNGSSVVLTPGISSPCGLRIKRSPSGNTIILASLLNCFARNVAGNDFTTTLNFRLLGNQMVEDEFYQLVKTCRYTAWASREIVCNSNYMEVSVRRTPSNDYPLPTKSIRGSKLGRAAEEKMQVTEAQRMYLITNTATRLFLLSPKTSPEIFSEDVSGVTMTVLKTSITFENKWMGTRINIAAACPTLESSVFFTENSIRWFLPQHISPLISGQFQLLEVHVGIDAVRLDPAEVEARQYLLTVDEVYIVLEIPFGAIGGHIKSSVQDNSYYASYEVEPMLELLWTEDGAHQDTRYKVFLPVVTPSWLQSVYVTDYTDPEKQFFDLLLGSFGPDVFLMNVSFPTGALSVDECNARGFNVLEHTFPGSSSKFFTLQVPFTDPGVLQTKERGMVVFSLHLTFGLLVMPGSTPFFHTTTLKAKVADVVPPSISGGCDSGKFSILVKYGTENFNFVTTVGKQQLTSSLAGEYSLMENGTHLSFLVPYSSSNVAYEAVEATSIRSRIDVALLDPQTKTVVEEFSLSCTFTKILTECFPNGTMTALAVKLESVPSLNPSQLVLEDPSCGPTYSDDRHAYFVFTGNTCGTTRKFLSNMMVYENEISLPDKIEKTKSKDEPEYELKVYCYYDINETHAVTFNTRSRRSEPYADDAQGQLKVDIRVASDDTYTSFHAAEDYPVAKYLQEPVYFEVELKGTKLTDILLQLDSCWATLDDDRLSQPRWNLIINGCANPVDPYQVIFHPVQVDERVHYPSHFKRFEVQMFAFAEDSNNLSQQVFVHCDVMICDAKKLQDGICNKRCSKEDGIKVTEWGDDVRPISEEEAMVIVNHQSTGDVCTLMMCLQDKGTVVRKMMWLMDHVFKYTNFGLVSLIHGDFFIRQGKAHRDKQLVYLKDHLEKYYHSRDRKWVVLFPEGGFLRKRRETSQLFAKKHSLPHLTHVTLPRLGATHVILKTLSAQQENGSVGSESGAPNQTGNKRKGLQWVIDVTIAYPKARPMDIQTWIFGYRPPTITHVHYRMYPIKEVPVEAEALTDWLYQRFVEKEELLAHFYDTGSFPHDGTQKVASRQMTLDPVWLCALQSFAFASGFMWYRVLQYLYCGLF